MITFDKLETLRDDKITFDRLEALWDEKSSKHFHEFPAKFPGSCQICKDRINEGDIILCFQSVGRVAHYICYLEELRRLNKDDTCIDYDKYSALEEKGGGWIRPALRTAYTIGLID